MHSLLRVPGPGGLGVRSDDSHALDLPPGNLRRRLDDLVRQHGGSVAWPADDGLSRETRLALGIPAFLPKPHQFGCCVNCFILEQAYVISERRTWLEIQAYT